MEKQKAAIYVRVSTIYQVDKDSLPMQKNDLVTYCELVLGIKDYEIFEDAGYSGKNTDRPAFQEMMNRIKAGEFSHILVWKLDRISRNIKDFANMCDEFRNLDVQFISKHDNFQTNTPMGRVMMNTLMNLAQFERETTSFRVKETMISRAKDGKWNGTAAPLGYTFDREKMYPVVDEEESKIVKFIFDEYERCHSSLYLTKLLNEKGVKTKRGGAWFTKTIIQILRNPMYIGTLRYNYQDSGRGKIRPESEWVVLPNNHEAIIDQEQFDRVQEILNRNAEPFRRKVFSKHVHIFSGLLQCAICGGGMSAHKDVKRKSGFHPSSYRCSKKAHGGLCPGTGIASDTTLTNFVLNYMSNMLSIQKSGNFDNLEKRLLHGHSFSRVAYLSEQSLIDIMDVMTLSYKPNLIKEDKNESNTSELEILHDRKAKLERALQRIENLFLFSDDAMGEKEYLEKRTELVSELNSIKAQITILGQSKNVVTSIIHSKFLDQCILDWQLGYGEEIDYKQLFFSVDARVLQEFLNDTIDVIILSGNNTVLEIRFKNGLRQQFLYRDSETKE